MKAAVKHGAQFVLFPELSLTGDEFAVARETFVSNNDIRLNELRALAKESKVTIVAGAPYTEGTGALHIAALSFLPDGRLAVYTKKHLHSGETEVFAPGCGGEHLDVQGTRIALAVCADISHADHAKRAAESGMPMGNW